jgi:hypothetical protein
MDAEMSDNEDHPDAWSSCLDAAVAKDHLDAA